MSTSRKIAGVMVHWLLPLIAFGIIVAGLLFVVGAFPYKIYIIYTGSMTPAIPTRSAVIVHEGPAQIGDVVTFRAGSGVITHRLVKQLADGTFQTKGDANETVDPGTISASQIIGPVVAAPRRLGYWLAYFKSPIGLASLIIAVVVIWLLYSLVTEFGRRRAPDDPSAPGPPGADTPENHLPSSGPPSAPSPD
jgi:signal peptidase I